MEKQRLPELVTAQVCFAIFVHCKKCNKPSYDGQVTDNACCFTVVAGRGGVKLLFGSI